MLTALMVLLGSIGLICGGHRVWFAKTSQRKTRP
jgi:hypothetical protein